MSSEEATETRDLADVEAPDAEALRKLSAGAFRARVDETFRIHFADGESIDTELVEVSGLKGDTPREDKSPFSLLFAGPEGAALEQGIYRFENDEMGSLDLFLVTVGPDPDDGLMRYEVVFT